MGNAKPYIGITDFESSAQAIAMVKVLSANSGVDSRRLLMVGVMMSRKTLNGLPTKWASVWPPKDRLAEIFAVHHRIVNTLHYADYDGEDVLMNLLAAARLGGIGLDAIQLDMVWPDPDALFTFCDARPNLKIVLQVGADALDMFDNDPGRVAQMLTEYNGALDYVLLDKSMGRGLGLSAAVLLPFLREIRARLPGLGLAVAGGLGPDTLHLIEPIVEEFPDISIDAQRQLRRSGDAKDPIDWGRATLYIQRAAQIFAEALQRSA